jgi:hypothetical protein
MKVKITRLFSFVAESITMILLTKTHLNFLQQSIHYIYVKNLLTYDNISYYMLVLRGIKYLCGTLKEIILQNNYTASEECIAIILSPIACYIYINFM